VTSLEVAILDTSGRGARFGGSADPPWKPPAGGGFQRLGFRFGALGFRRRIFGLDARARFLTVVVGQPVP